MPLPGFTPAMQLNHGAENKDAGRDKQGKTESAHPVYIALYPHPGATQNILQAIRVKKTPSPVWA